MSANPRREEAPVTGAEMITIERHRQIETEGYTRQHDLGHGAPDLLRAARCYEVPQVGDRAPDAWPWDASAWKPRDPASNLVRAGALYQAAVDVSPPLGNDRSLALAGRDRCAKVLDWYAERIAQARREGADEAHGIRFRVETACDGYANLTEADVPDEVFNDDDFHLGAQHAAEGIRAALRGDA